jgi:hypothetical protein
LAAYWFFSLGFTSAPVAWGWLSVAFCLLLCRDIRRAYRLLESDLHGLLKMDAFYCGLTLVLLLVATGLGHVSLIEVLIAMSLPAIPGLLRSLRPRGRQGFGETPDIALFGRPGWGDIWFCARWALPGVLVGWLNNSAYWFYLDSTQGKQALAQLAVARLLFTPLSLISSGWTGYFRPILSRMELAGDSIKKIALLHRYSVFACAMVIIYTGLLICILWCWPRLLPSKTQPGSVLILLWGGYFGAQCLRNIRMSNRLSSPNGFRYVFHTGAIFCAIFYLLLFPLSRIFHTPLIYPLLLGACEAGNYILLSDRMSLLSVQDG